MLLILWQSSVIRGSAFNSAENDEADVVNHILVCDKVHERGESTGRLGANMVKLVDELATAAVNNQFWRKSRATDACQPANITISQDAKRG
jgi:hypothetical protein